MKPVLLILFVGSAQAAGTNFAQLESEKRQGACAGQVLGVNEKCVDLGTIGTQPAPKPCNTGTNEPNDPGNCVQKKK